MEKQNKAVNKLRKLLKVIIKLSKLAIGIITMPTLITSMFLIMYPPASFQTMEEKVMYTIITYGINTLMFFLIIVLIEKQLYTFLYTDLLKTEKNSEHICPICGGMHNKQIRGKKPIYITKGPEIILTPYIYEYCPFDKREVIINHEKLLSDYPDVMEKYQNIYKIEKIEIEK